MRYSNVKYAYMSQMNSLYFPMTLVNLTKICPIVLWSKISLNFIKLIKNSKGSCKYLPQLAIEVWATTVAMKFIIEVMQVGCHANMYERNMSDPELLISIFTKQGSINLGIKRKTSVGKYPFLWSQISDYARIALANEPSHPPVLTLILYTPFKSIITWL